MKPEHPHLLSIGIDVGSDFSYMSIVIPSHQFLGKPFKITHKDLSSLNLAVKYIKKAEEEHPDLTSRILLESTGVYHYPLFCFFKNQGLNVDIVNPLITHSNQNFNIRKVHNDKLDSKKIALLGLNPYLKVSIIPDDFVLNLRNLTREYYRLVSARTTSINKLVNQLDQSFPQFIGLFSKTTAVSSLMILEDYTTPDSILAEDKDVLIKKINTCSRIGVKKTQEKYNLLVKACHAANVYGHFQDSNTYLIKYFIRVIRFHDIEIKQIEAKINTIINSNSKTHFVKQVNLIQSFTGAGFLSSVALLCEIGDFQAFKKPKQLYAYFGLDPAVKQSGKFNATSVHISKRGSKIARRSIYTFTLRSISKKRNGVPLNPVIRDYYLKKCESKSKMTAQGAVMHKVCNIIFAILRDEAPYVMITPEQHALNYIHKHLEAA